MLKFDSLIAVLHQCRTRPGSVDDRSARIQPINNFYLDALEPRLLLAGNTYYVDNTGGSDTNDGASVATAFETIQHAADVAQPGDTIYILGGTYYENVVVPRSGVAGNPITFRAYNNQTVVLSGADPVTGWVPHSGNIWKTTVNWNTDNNRAYNTLFVNGELKYEARQGAENDFFDINDWGELVQGRLVDFASSFRVDDLFGFPNDYWNGAKITFHTFDYRLETRTITDFNAFTGMITLDAPVGNVEQKQNNGYYIHDTLKAVDQPGEWFKDTGNTLYYHAAPGENPNNLLIELKSRPYAFDVQGRDYIHIQGLDFRGASILTSGGTDFNVYQDNRFYAYDKGGYGTFHLNGDNNTLRDNEFSYTWGSVVRTSGTRNAIINNYIHHIGLNPVASVIIASEADELLFSHNTIRTYARNVMAGYPSRSEIAYNLIEDGGKLTWDTATFDSDSANGNSSHSIFHHNIFRNTSTRGIFETFYGRNDNAVIHHNLVYDFNPNANRTIFRSSGIDFRKVYHNTFITGLAQQPAGQLQAAGAIQTQYNNNIQISMDRMAAIGVDVRGNHNYTPSDFVDYAGKDFRLAPGSPAIDTGIVLPGINDGYLGAAPDAGAFESGAPMWTAGHDFVNKPSPTYSWVPLPGTNLYDNNQFLQGIGDWTIISGTPNSQDRNSWNLQQSGAALTGTFNTQSVELTPGEAISRVFTGLSPDTTYTLGAAARVVNRVTNGNQFNASSGSVTTGSHRNENFSVGMSAGEWIRFDNIDFGDADQYDQIDLLHIRNPLAAYPSIDGSRVQVRLDAPNGPLLAEFSELADGTIGDRWRATRTDLLIPVSGVHSIYLSTTGSNSHNLAMGSLRLLNSAPIPSDLLTVKAASPGADTIVASLGSEDWYIGYDEITFTTGPSATTAEIRFENQGRLDAYLDRLYLVEGVATRGGAPRSLSSRASAERSLGPTVSAPADEVLDGQATTSAQTGDHAGSWIQVDLGERAAVYNIRLTPSASTPGAMSNIRVSVWNADPDDGGIELWSQDYLTDGSSLGSGESLMVHTDAFGRDGQTRLGDVQGRYVRVQALGPNAVGNHRLELADIHITLFDENNWAQTDGVASQSSTENGYAASSANDGDPSTRSATLPTDVDSWWQVRLSQPTSIGRIELVNVDTDQYMELSNFTVSVWDDDPDSGGNRIWEKTYYTSGSVGRGESLVIDGSEISDSGDLRLATAYTGRVVRIQLNGTNNAENGRLSLADVRVTPSHVHKARYNLAQHGIASQSHDYYGDTATYSQNGFAHTANDGVIQPESNFTSTLNESGAWWQVDLQSPSNIDQIVLVNRTDVPERLDNFTVSVWDGDPDNGGTQLWSRNYGYSSGAPTYATTAIGAGGALIINGSTTSSGTRLDAIQNAHFVRVQLNGANILSLVEVQVWGTNVLTESTTIDPTQSTYRYDLGPLDGNEVFDHTYQLLSPVVSGDVYWTAPVEGVDYGSGTGQNNLNRDLIRKGDGPAIFEHKVADGIWEVLVTIGDDGLPVDQVSLSAEGTEYLSGITRPAGLYINEIFQVPVEDGSLSLGFSDLGGVNSFWSVSRIILTRVGDLPILEGDLNDDGFVGILDLNVVLGSWNTNAAIDPRADPTFDGYVGIEDLNLVLSNWNTGTPPNGSAKDVVLPETGSSEPVETMVGSQISSSSSVLMGSGVQEMETRPEAKPDSRRTLPKRDHRIHPEPEMMLTPDTRSALAVWNRGRSLQAFTGEGSAYTPPTSEKDSPDSPLGLWEHAAISDLW